jgi:hypothetical protein
MFSNLYCLLEISWIYVVLHFYTTHYIIIEIMCEVANSKTVRGVHLYIVILEYHHLGTLELSATEIYSLIQ